MKKIENLGYEIIMAADNSNPDYGVIGDCEVLVCYNPFEYIDLDKLPNLKWIQLSSIGIDQLPYEKLLNREIVITNNKGGYSIPMGEWIVLKLLEMFKNSRGFYRKQENREWKVDTSLLELYKKRVLFIGTGTIAVEGAKRLQGFGCDVEGVNTDGREVEYFSKCYPIKSLYEIIGGFDAIVIAIPYTKETHHLIGETAFKAMKDEAFLINISRGSVIDEKALIENLENGRIRGAALDVFEEEPLPNDNPLWKLENVLITPHNSWISERRNERRFNTIYENMLRYKNNEPLKNMVDILKGY